MNRGGQMSYVNKLKEDFKLDITIICDNEKIKLYRKIYPRYDDIVYEPITDDDMERIR